MDFGKKSDAKKAMKLKWKEGITLKQAWKKVKKMSPKKKKAVSNAKKAMKLKWKEGITLKQAWKKVNKFGDTVCPAGFEPNLKWERKTGQRQCIKMCDSGMYRDLETNKCRKTRGEASVRQPPDGYEINPSTGRLRKVCLPPNVRNERGRCVQPRGEILLKPGYEINPSTGRLRKVCLPPNVRNERGRCAQPRGEILLKPGYEINPSTGRQRKMCLPGQYRDPVSGKCKTIKQGSEDFTVRPLLISDAQPGLLGLMNFGNRGRCGFGTCNACAK